MLKPSIINKKFKLTFHNTSKFTFATLLGDPDKLATNLGNFIAGFSSRARKILEKFKFEEEIEKLDEANRLFEIIKEFASVDLHPDRFSPIEMVTYLRISFGASTNRPMKRLAITSLHVK